MRTLLPKKDKYYKDFADVIYRTAVQMRYGIESCKTSLIDPILSSVRKELVDWQSNEDESALSQTSITTWVPVTYRNDAMVQFDMTQNSWGPGYYNSQTVNGPGGVQMGYAVGGASGNIIEVNTGGCITRINLNPSVVINQNSSFVYTQIDPSTEWVIQHNMGMVPNVSTEDLNGADIQGIVEPINNNLLKIYFNQPVAGKAYLS